MDDEPKEYYDAVTFAYNGKLIKDWEQIKSGDWVKELNKINKIIKESTKESDIEPYSGLNYCWTVKWELYKKNYLNKIESRGNIKIHLKELAKNLGNNLRLKHQIYDDRGMFVELIPPKEKAKYEVILNETLKPVKSDSKIQFAKKLTYSEKELAYHFAGIVGIHCSLYNNNFKIKIKFANKISKDGDKQICVYIKENKTLYFVLDKSEFKVEDIKTVKDLITTYRNWTIKLYENLSNANNDNKKLVLKLEDYPTMIFNFQDYAKKTKEKGEKSFK